MMITTVRNRVCRRCPARARPQARAAGAVQQLFRLRSQAVIGNMMYLFKLAPAVAARLAVLVYDFSLQTAM